MQNSTVKTAIDNFSRNNIFVLVGGRTFEVEKFFKNLSELSVVSYFSDINESDVFRDNRLAISIKHCGVEVDTLLGVIKRYSESFDLCAVVNWNRNIPSITYYEDYVVQPIRFTFNFPNDVKIITDINPKICRKDLKRIIFSSNYLTLLDY